MKKRMKKLRLSSKLLAGSLGLTALGALAIVQAQPAPGASGTPSGAASSAPGSAGQPPTCVEACERSKLVLSECAATESNNGPVVLSEAARVAQITMLDCKGDCAFWTEAEVKRVDGCFPQETCGAYTKCLNSGSEVQHVEPKGTRTRTSDGAAMVLIPAGPFLVGAPADTRAFDERALESVELPAYWIDRDEVTMERYRACFVRGACPGPEVDTVRSADESPPEGTTSRIRQGCNWGVAGREEHPINCVTQLSAIAYCSFAGARLPSELEWEKAARGTSARLYPWGIAPPDCSRAHIDTSSSYETRGCSTKQTAKTGSRLTGESPWGVREMSGNVWEWVGGHYASSSYAEPKDDRPSSDYQTAFGVLRGGGWGVDWSKSPTGKSDETATTSNRFRMFKHLTLEGVGFRCVTEGGAQ